MTDASCILPEGPLYGHYSLQKQLYTVHSGSPDIVLNTPIPEQAPAIDSSTINPSFRQPRYLSLNYPYLLFIPKQYVWRHQLFKTFDRPRHKLPIIKDGDEGFRLHPDIAENWLELENCLRALGKEMLRLAPQGWLPRLVNPFFFPTRFKFLLTFRTEHAARFAAWRSMDNFLPLLGYVSMGLWCMQSWESDELARGADPPDWRVMVTENTKVHPTFLDYVEKSVVGDWHEERVGALYRIQAVQPGRSDEREQRREIEWLLATIFHSNFPIPIYLSWGGLPKQLSTLDVPAAFQEFAPNTDELKYLASVRGQLKFSRWAIDNASLAWYQNPYTPMSMPVAPAPPSPPPPSETESLPWHRDPSPAAVAPAPFPPLPPHSKQKKDETIQAFFIRRRDANIKKMANENPTDQQRRKQRADHAKLGQVPSKACVFFWEEQDGHYIRQPGGRGSYAQLWREYPAPQRRYDPISNEWDLCELFEDNDPVFGEVCGKGSSHDDDDDDDDDFEHPTFPQDTDMASLIPQEDDNMEVVQKQHPHEMASIEDVPGDEDLGPDFTEADVPKCNLTDASMKCVNLVYLKFGRAPRTEEPEYESSAGNLLSALERRFGFMMPSSPENFVPRDRPQRCLKPELLADVVGMTDIGATLASQKGLEDLLSIFFGQCMEARSAANIDRHLLDYHQPQSVARSRSPFEIGRELLTSMRNPSERQCYYVLRKIDSGIGSEVLLLPRATYLLEVLRQQWGPDIKDVAGHFLARGIPFWLAYISAEIMPASETPTPLALRPKGFKVDTSSGLGFRPKNYKFDQHDYNAYITQRDLQLLHTPRGRIALQYGGVMARLARSEVSDDDFFCGFSDDIYNVGDCLWDGTSVHAYWHDRLSDHEVDLLCGVYHVATGQKNTDQTGIVSWWPKPSAWARGSLDGAGWTPQCEDVFFQKRLHHFQNGVYLLKHQSDWRHNLKYQKDVKKCWDGYERVAESIVQALIAAVSAHRS
ncbi:hypothetical protein FB451DRAFT_1187792 [Mycena latifolia]|nr:hypothetical protein FB451DRAFT_1187792 [Mycena latifolia]